MTLILKALQNGLSQFNDALSRFSKKLEKGLLDKLTTNTLVSPFGLVLDYFGKSKGFDSNAVSVSCIRMGI